MSSNADDSGGSHSHIQPTSLIKVATVMVDSVTNLLYNQIAQGDLSISEQQKQLLKNFNQVYQEQSKTLDLDEHRRRVRKFMQMNKRHRKNRQRFSIQNSEKSLKQSQLLKKEEQDNKQKVLTQRRRQIQKRMDQKKNMLRQIQKSALESNVRISSLKRQKSLYQEKQELYYKNVVLPKLQYERNVLNKKKQLRKPIDMTQLFQHQRKYEQFRINERLNRSITVRRVRQNQYEPPKFVPESYRKSKIQQQLAKEEEQLKKREIEMNGIRQRQFSKKIEEIREKQRESSQYCFKTPEKKLELKQKIKSPSLNREQLKSVGNQYLKELLAKNRKFATAKKFKSAQENSRRKVRSEYEIEIVREERIEKVKKIRNRKIDEIFNDSRLNDYERHEKLRHQIQRLDQAAEDKLTENMNIETVNESASIMMSSIHAKLAILSMHSPRK